MGAQDAPRNSTPASTSGSLDASASFFFVRALASLAQAKGG